MTEILNPNIFDDDSTFRSNQENIDLIIAYLKQLGTTGWAEYADTTYTEESPFAVTADTDTIIPNNAGSVRDGECLLIRGKKTGRSLIFE